MNKALLQEIAKARGLAPATIEGKLRVLKMDSYDKETGLTWLRGFLLDPETLKKWFGTKKTYDHHCYRCECMDDEGLEMWAYHAQQMAGLSLEAILTYYAEHKRE